jgi:DtxR family Mn-dependent transcriptional regulator
MELSLSESLEDYLLDIFEITIQGKIARISEIAKKRGVKLSSAFDAVKTLAEKKLLKHERYGYVMLSDYGIEQARELYERKKILLKFLINIIGVPQEIAIKDVHKMEHDLSKETIEAIIKFTSSIKGTNKIKDKNKIKEDNMILSLKDLKVGEMGKIISIKEGIGSLKNKLLTMGAVNGTIVKVEKVAPLGDPIDVLVRGYHLTLRKEEAKQILIEKI